MQILNYTEKTTIISALIYTRMDYQDIIYNIKNKKTKNKSDKMSIDYYTEKIKELTALIDKFLINY